MGSYNATARYEKCGRRREYPVPGFWERLDDAIRARGKTRTQVARESGISPGSLTCNRGQNLSLPNLYKICRSQGFSADALLGLGGRIKLREE